MFYRQEWRLFLQKAYQRFCRKSRAMLGYRHMYHISFLPCCLYIEAPEIAEIQEFIKFSAYSHLVSHAACILDDLDCHFLHSTSIPDVPCTRSWVQIIHFGIYKSDLAIVSLMPSTGNIVTIAVVPYFWNKKRKSKGNARPALAFLDPKVVAKFSCNENNVHSIGSGKFTSNGLEFLQVTSVHALKIKPCPSGAELLSFQSSFGIVDKTFELDLVIQHSVNKAFHCYISLHSTTTTPPTSLTLTLTYTSFTSTTFPTLKSIL